MNNSMRLPTGWRLVSLGDEDVAQINPRRPSSLTRSDSTKTTFVPMEAVDAELGIISAPQIKPYGAIKKGYTYFEEGDVLFAKITPCMQNGKHSIARNLIDGIGFGTTEFHVIRPVGPILSEWIHYYLRQPHILSEATKHFTGAVGQRRVPKSFLDDLSIPLPSLAEQKRLLKTLSTKMDGIERARLAAEAQLAAINSLPAALIHQAYSGEL